jgi:alpha-glucoside transport system permease protein
VGRLVSPLIAVVVGVGGGVVLLTALNALVARMPRRWERRLIPYVFAGPALAVVAGFLVGPAVRSLYISLFDETSTGFVGLANYRALFTDPGILEAIVNNLRWIIVVPASCVFIGLVVAALADRLSGRWEAVSKSVIFLPMAISFVGAATIWQFVYAFRPEGRPQVGLLNQIWTSLGGSPVAWLQDTAINDFMLMIVFVWLHAGFAMVLLSAAIKSVPEELGEAAGVDGATRLQTFRYVVAPHIRSTIIVVFTTVLIGVLKVFDIVRVMTNGNFGTEVVANRFIKELFTYREFGRAAALVTFLMVAIIPIMIVNVRRFRQEDLLR